VTDKRRQQPYRKLYNGNGPLLNYDRLKRATAANAWLCARYQLKAV